MNCYQLYTISTFFVAVCGIRTDSLLDDVPALPPPSLLMDDFYNIAQESPGGTEVNVHSFKNFFGFGKSSSQAKQQPQSSESSERGRHHPPHAGAEGRRTSSQAPPTDRRRCRSSSLAPASSRGGAEEKVVSSATATTNSSNTTPHSTPVRREHQTLHRISTGNRRSRSPAKIIGSELVPSKVPFIVNKTIVANKSKQATVISCVVFSPTGSLLVTGDSSGEVTLYSNLRSDSVSSRVVNSEANIRGSISSLMWLNDSDRHMLAAGQSSNLLLYDCVENRSVWEVGTESSQHLKERRILCASANPSSSSVLLSVAPRVSRTSAGISTLQPALLSLDVKSRQIDMVLQFQPGTTVNGCTINHNGSLVVCGCSDGSVRIVDLRCSDVIARWPAHKGQVFTVRLSHHQEKLYTVGSDNKVSYELIVVHSKRFS